MKYFLVNHDPGPNRGYVGVYGG